MTENLNVKLEIKKNIHEEVEVNGYNRRSLVNGNLFGNILSTKY